MRPTHGGTLRLELRSSDPSGARYELALSTRSGEWRALAAIGVDGSVTFSEWSALEPPEYLCATASAILRTLLRDPATRQGKGWPRRIQRWRADPDPSEKRQ
jgi:hypothetical protein